MPDLSPFSLDPRTPQPQRIDAHQHLWNFEPEEFAWITDEMSLLRRDFLEADLCTALNTVKIDASIVVQTSRSVAETERLLDCARRTSAIAAVIGWLPLHSEDLPALLDHFDTRHLVGLRHIVQAEPDGFLEAAAFNRGIANLTARNLTYDLLIYERQLPEAIQFVDRHPQQRFILNHAAKPRIAAGELQPWANRLRELAQRSNVFCKLSGLTTEAHWNTWTLDTLRPYLDLCVEAFGPGRLLAGSDWPVCLLATSYQRWWNALHEYFSTFAEDEQRQIFGTNAATIYRLSSLSQP
jgi:L-fuconolactonase